MCAHGVGNIDIIGLKLFSHPGQSNTLTGYYQAAIILPRIPILLAGAYVTTTLFPYLARGSQRDLVHAGGVSMNARRSGQPAAEWRSLSR